MTLPAWKKNLPMQLTWSRVYAVPPLLLMMNQPGWAWALAASLMFVAASLTDYFDGYFARKYNAVSTMGQFMDPVTDKILVTSVLAQLVAHQRVDVFLLIFLMARDTLIGGIRSVAAVDKVVIAAKPTGKWKTGLQMVAIPMVLLGPTHEFLHVFEKIGYGLLWASVILSILSAIEYYQLLNRSQKAAERNT